MDKGAVLDQGTKRSFILPVSFYQTWIVTGGVYMMAGRCPCCGGQGCAVGLGTAAVVGGAMAGLTHGAGVLRKVFNNRKKKAE